MRFLLLFFTISSMACSATAQIGLLRGFIKSAQDFEPLNNVQIRDVQTGRIVVSDSSGFFEISTSADHILELSRMSLKKQQIHVKAAMFLSIQQIILQYEVRELPEATVTEKSKYQIDSVERYQTYKLDLERKRERVKLDSIVERGNSFGLIINAPLSKRMEKVSQKSKKRIRFQNNFAKWEQQKYIEQKYDAVKVATLTGLQNDSLAWFMNAFPMTYEMARQSDEQEIDYWIRANFEDWKTNAGSLILKLKIED